MYVHLVSLGNNKANMTIQNFKVSQISGLKFLKMSPIKKIK